MKQKEDFYHRKDRQRLWSASGKRSKGLHQDRLRSQWFGLLPLVDCSIGVVLTLIAFYAIYVVSSLWLFPSQKPQQA